MSRVFCWKIRFPTHLWVHMEAYDLLGLMLCTLFMLKDSSCLMPWTWSGSIRVSNYRIYRYVWNLRINTDELRDLHGNMLTEIHSRDEIYIDEAGMMYAVFTWGTAESQNPFVIQLEWFENSWIFLLTTPFCLWCIFFLGAGYSIHWSQSSSWLPRRSNTEAEKRPPMEKNHLHQTFNLFGVPKC